MSPHALAATSGRPRVALGQQHAALLALIVLLATAGIQFPGFLDLANVQQLALAAAFTGIIAIGMTFVIFTGGIDLSVGSVFALSGVVAAWASEHGPVAAILLPLAVAGVIGLVQGLLIGRVGLPAFIVTLAGLLFARGLLLLISDEGATTYKVADSTLLALGQGTWLGFGIPVWIFVAIAAAAIVAHHRSRFGSSVLALGSDSTSARLMGVRVGRTTTATYVISALLAGLAGMLTAGYTSSGVTVLGVGLELTVIGAVVIGGTLLTGGRGSVLGTVAGVLVLEVVALYINRLGLADANWQAIASGTILLVVATAQRLVSARASEIGAT